MPSEPTTAALDESQRRELAAANERARPIRRAAGVALFNGWSIGVLAALSAPFAVFGLSNLVIAAAMGAIAWNEFRGRHGLRRFEPAAATRLGYNQLAFLGLIVAYCLWGVASAFTGDSEVAAQFAARPEYEELLGDVGALEATIRLAVAAFYGLVALLSVLFQGGNAWYYFSRRRVVERYLRETPEWVVDLQRLTLDN